MLLEIFLAETLALVGGTVHTMEPGAAPEVALVLIEDGRVRAVGAGLEVPEGARVIDASGLHVIPGLIDGLAYHDPEHDDLYTAAGVTLLRDHGNDLARILKLREAEARDRALGPWLSICGAVLDGYPPSSATALVLRDEHEVHNFVPTLIAEEIDFLAVQIQLGEKAWREVLAQAHPEEGERLQVWGPKPRAVTLDQLIESGQDGLLFLDALLPEGRAWEGLDPNELDPLVARLAKAGVRITPLLRGTARMAETPGQDAPQLELLSNQYTGMWRGDLEVRTRLEADFAERARRVLAVQRALVARLDRSGVTLVPGSGAPHPWLMPGRGLVDELAEWQAAGLSAARCLELATAGSAGALELEGRGTLAVGSVADVVLLGADPTEDIEALRDVRGVVLRGRLLEKAELDARVGELKKILGEIRALASAPIEVDPPSVPAGSTELLSGLAETSTEGGRIAAERWAIARAKNGDVSFCGRRVVPGTSKASRVEIDVIQTLRKTQLVSFSVRLSASGHEIAVRGELVAGTMRVERRMDGAFVDNKSAREELACVDASSVTTLMLIAHAREAGPMPVLRFDEALELEVVRWTLALQEDGGHWLKTPTGRKFAAFRPDGALKAGADWQGAGVTKVESRSIDDHGGPGLPLPEAKRKAVLDAEAAQAAEASAGGKPGGG
jgi:hypothetical protein